MESADYVPQSNSSSTQVYHFTSICVVLSFSEEGHHVPHRPSIGEQRLIAGNMRKHFFNFTSNAAVTLLMAYFTVLADCVRPGLPVKISVLSTVMALATALVDMAVELGGEGEHSRAVHVIDAAVAVSSTVAFTSLSWMLLDGGYRWIACLLGVFVSICIFYRRFLGWFGYLANRLGSRAGHDSILPI